MLRFLGRPELCAARISAIGGILLSMYALSRLAEQGIMIRCASPVYAVCEPDYRPGARLTFEVLEADASSLKRLVGKTETFGTDSEHLPFIGQLVSLEPCTSSVAALSLMRAKPAMRGVIVIERLVDLRDPAQTEN
jgi:hypothetical protein